MHHLLRRTSVVTVALLGALALLAPAQAANAPVEPYARYEPQSNCFPKAKAGTLALARWVTTTYRGGFGPISRPCAGRSVSEHKEGRAFDWMNDATKATDRARTSCHVVQERRS